MVRVIAKTSLPSGVNNMNVKGDIVDIFQPSEIMGWVCTDPTASTSSDGWKKFGAIIP
jgi:hypothetical protein